MVPSEVTLARDIKSIEGKLIVQHSNLECDGNAANLSLIAKECKEINLFNKITLTVQLQVTCPS